MQETFGDQAANQGSNAATLLVVSSQTYGLPMNPWPPVIGGVVALLCLLGAMAVRRKRRLIDDLPTSKAHGVFIGFVELSGTAEAARPIRSTLAAVSCVAYSWSCEEHWSKTSTYVDSK